MDREWSSQILAPDQKGWDWFSLHLSDGSKVMLFRLRGNLTYLSGNWIMPNGDTTALTANEIKLEPLEETKNRSPSRTDSVACQYIKSSPLD